MTHKHFTLIANNLRTYARPHMSRNAYGELVDRIAIDLKLCNPAFNTVMFAEACLKP